MRPGPTARAAAVLVVFLALFVAVDRLSGQRPPRAATASGSSRPAAATTSPTSASAATSTSTAPSSRPPASTAPVTTTSTSEPTRATGTTLRSPRGVTVQVLNGVFVPGLARRVADRIRRAGYEVVAIRTALGSYTVSRIYYTDGHQADAEAFRARFPAFRTILPASQARTGLDPEVALHVVIGDNYQEI